MRIKKTLFAASLTIVVLTACASPTIAPESNTLSAEILLRAELLTGETDVTELGDVAILEMDPSMLAFLDEHSEITEQISDAADVYDVPEIKRLLAELANRLIR